MFPEEGLHWLPGLVVVDEDGTKHEGGCEEAGQDYNDNPLHSPLLHISILLIIPVDRQLLLLLVPDVDVHVDGPVGGAVGLGDDHVAARPELLLGSAPNLARPVPTGS